MLGLLSNDPQAGGVLARFIDLQYAERVIDEMPEAWRSLCAILHDAKSPKAPTYFMNALFTANSATLALLRSSFKNAPIEVAADAAKETLHRLIERFLDVCYEGHSPFTVVAEVDWDAGLLAQGYLVVTVTATSNDTPTRTMPWVYVFDKPRSVLSENKGFDVICDERNNTEASIANHQLNVELVVHDPELANAFRQNQHPWRLESDQSQPPSCRYFGPTKSSDD